MPEKVAILLDGGFVKKKLSEKHHHFATVQEVTNLCQQAMAHNRLSGKELFRIYYYDAPPFEGKSRNPISGAILNFSTTPQAGQNKALIDSLELQPDFAVRRGVIVQSGWKLGKTALKSLARKSRPVTAGDLVPDMAQKGVDIRIGLDIAWISLKRIVDVLVLVTGDSDFVPVMKFARKEGLKVYLETLGHPVRRELKAHADFVL
jgi:uncharacterized LabA/DUF88 family protein